MKVRLVFVPPGGEEAVSEWIGHAISVSGRHDANAILDELFDRLVGEAGGANSGAASSRIGLQRPAGSMSEELAAAPRPAPCQEIRHNAAPCGSVGKWSRGESNPRPEAVSKTLLRVCPVI